MSKLYIAYGSNMNLAQMVYRCPTAKAIGIGSILAWKLVFRGNSGGAVANIEATKKGNVPVVVWDIKPKNEKALDRYEGYPWLYRKENIVAIVEGTEVTAMVYIMNEGRPIGTPSERYYETIKQGYIDNGIDVKILDKFLKSQSKR